MQASRCRVHFCCPHSLAQLQKYDDPVLVSSDIQKKLDVLERVCKPIASKPPPKKEAPAAPAAAAAPAADAAAAGPEVAEAAAGEEASAAEPQVEEMDEQ
jgi:hypothetical protein